jgi:hypothetical protein
MSISSLAFPDNFIKCPDAALHRILRPCGLQQAYRRPHDWRALPAELFLEAFKPKVCD